MTHPGVGPVTALATDVFLGDPARFADGKALANHVITTSSVVVDRSSRKAVKPLRGCLKRAMVRIVTGPMIKLPASLTKRSSNNSSWSMVTREMFGGLTPR